MISCLKELGVYVRGVDNSLAAFSNIPENVKFDVTIASVTQPLDLGRFDLVLSTEVAEHIGKRDSAGLVRNLTRNATCGIFFTAAAPGQGGDGHINCQPKSYWVELFGANGWCVSETLQNKVLQAIQQRPRINALLPCEFDRFGTM